MLATVTLYQSSRFVFVPVYSFLGNLKVTHSAYWINVNKCVAFVITVTTAYNLFPEESVCFRSVSIILNINIIPLRGEPN